MTLDDTVKNIIMQVKIKGFQQFMSQVSKLGKSLNTFTKSPLVEGFKDWDNQFKRNQQSLREFSSQMKEQYANMDKAAIRSNKMRQKADMMMQGGAQKILNQVSSAQRLADSYDSLAGAFGMPLSAMRTMEQNGARLNNVWARGVHKVRMMTHGLRGFRMEMLGVMFFGMMMQKFFAGLLRPVMEVFGVFDLWRVMLQVLFLPIMIELMPYFLDFIQWVMDLPEPVKKAIGVIALLGVLLGGFLYLLGSIALGIGSVILALGPMGLGLIKAGSALKFLGTIFGGVSATMLIVAAVIVAIFVGMWLAWKENFGNMKDWVKVFVSSIKDFFRGLKRFISGILKIIVSIFQGDFEGAIDGVKEALGGLVDMFTSSLKGMLSLVVMLGLGVARIFKGMFDFITGGWLWVMDKLNELTGGWVEKTRDSIVSLLRRIQEAMFWSNPLLALGMEAVINKIEAFRFTAPAPEGFVGPLQPGQSAPTTTYNEYSPTINVNVVDKEEVGRIVDDYFKDNISKTQTQ